MFDIRLGQDKANAWERVSWGHGPKLLSVKRVQCEASSNDDWGGSSLRQSMLVGIARTCSKGDVDGEDVRSRRSEGPIIAKRQ